MTKTIIPQKKFGFESFCDGVIQIFAIGVLGLLFLSNLVCTTWVVHDWSEHVHYEVNWAILLLPVFIVLFCKLLDKLCQWKETTLFLMGSLLYAVVIAYILLNIENVLRSDALHVFEGAHGIAAGNYSSLRTTGYLGHYPHQLGLAIYDLLLGYINKSEKLIFIANYVEVLLIDWFGFRATQEYFQDERINKTLIVLEFAFLPQMFFIMFGYGLIPGFCCLMIAVYQVICILKEKPHIYKHAVLAVVFMGLAVLLKKNYIIGAAAIAITLFLYFLRKKNWKIILLSVLMLAVPFAGTVVIKNAVAAATGVESIYNVPSTAYVAMGTDLHNTSMAPGWYIWEFETMYTTEVSYNTEIASEVAAQRLKNNMAETVSHPGAAFKFYGKKILSTWCDPLFQSVWSGPGPYMGAEVKSTVLLSLYSGGKVELLLRIIMKCMVISLLGTALLFFKRHRQEFPETTVAYLYLIGGFLFHIVWETKSQYVYTYVFLLLPMCAYEICALRDWYKQKKKARAAQ